MVTKRSPILRDRSDPCVGAIEVIVAVYQGRRAEGKHIPKHPETVQDCERAAAADKVGGERGTGESCTINEEYPVASIAKECGQTSTCYPRPDYQSIVVNRSHTSPPFLGPWAQRAQLDGRRRLGMPARSPDGPGYRRGMIFREID
jgi:hypothetical protein